MNDRIKGTLKYNDESGKWHWRVTLSTLDNFPDYYIGGGSERLRTRALRRMDLAAKRAARRAAAERQPVEELIYDINDGGWYPANPPGADE